MRAPALRLWPGLLLAVAGFAACWVAFFPGFMSYDSLVQYAMSRSFEFDDWYPPLMSWVWGGLNPLFPGPSGMLALQLGLLWAALFAWWAAWRAHRGAWLLLAIGVLPWVVNFAGVLWKDVLMAGVLLLATRFALTAATPVRAALALALMFCAINLRYNAVLAAAPVLWCLVRAARPSLGRSLAAGVTVLTLAAYLAGGSLISYQLLGAKRSLPSNYMLLDDLVHLSLVEGRSVVPGVDMRQVQDCAARELGQTQLVGKYFCLRETPAGRAAAESPALRAAWQAQVLQHPWDWLRFRLAAFAYLLRSPQQDPYYIWHPGVDENAQGVHFQPNAATTAAQQWVQATAGAVPVLFKPYAWLALDLALLLVLTLAPASRTVQAARMLLASSALYVMGYLPVTPMADFRYVYWSVLASTVALTLLAIDRRAWLEIRHARRLRPVLALAVLLLALAPLTGRLLVLDVDTAVLRTLTGSPTQLAKASRISDLLPESGRLKVVGADPWLAWDIDGLSPAAFRFLKLEFSCEKGAGRPVLQIFWWGDGQAGPSESRTWATALRQGTQLLPISAIPGLPALRSLEGLRLDLFDPSACGSITLDNVALVP